MVKNQIHVIMAVIQCDAVLPTNEIKTLAQFQEKMLQVIDDTLLQLCFGNPVRFGNFQEI